MTTADRIPDGAAGRSGVGDAVLGRRWRLLLGDAAEVDGAALGADERRMDDALSALYDADRVAANPEHAASEWSLAPRLERAGRRGGLGSSAPGMARWLGDIRAYFPTPVVQVLQRDAVQRLRLDSLLLEPELLDAVQPDVHLVSLLISLHRVMPDTTRRTARAVVARVVAQIEERVARQTRTAVVGALRRTQRTHRPRPSDIDWNATIATNLRHYLPEQRTVVPQRLIGRARGAPVLPRQVVVAVDQSGSMAESLVYAAVFAASLASMRALRTSLVVFDTEVVDLTEQIADPVELLFACQLGGGTDLVRAVRYCAGLIDRPGEAVLVLVSDLFDGGSRGGLARRLAAQVAAGVTVIVLLALSDEGAPVYDHEQAATLNALGITVFACSPDRFPDLIAAALTGGDLAAAATAASAEQHPR